MIGLLIADDHPLIRAGFRHLCAADSSIRIVGEAADGEALLGKLERSRPDVVVLDLAMPGPPFAELIARIRRARPHLRVLVVSVHPEGETALRALRAGADGYVTKSRSPEELLRAVRIVHGGGKYVSPFLAKRLAAGWQAGRRDPALSRREAGVLRLLAAGRLNKEIAAAFRLSPKTVSTYRSRVLKKLGLKTNADLVRYAIEQMLVQ